MYFVFEHDLDKQLETSDGNGFCIDCRSIFLGGGQVR